MTRPGSLGSGLVTYHPSRPIVHFGNAHEETYRSPTIHKLEIAKEIPDDNRRPS